ncbi:hypothetical protein Tco_0821508 [Tanacetum coccineum]|uniref:Uncharacterized protein n=1 Tax=Tanacetum coccineum TaxID=301880 RepID=A0ABQ5AH92_9ASTR
MSTRHQLPVSSKDSNKTNLLHLGPGRGRRVVCSTGWEEKTEKWGSKRSFKAVPGRGKDREVGNANMVSHGKLSPTDKTHQGSGGDTSYQAKRWRIHEGLYGKIQGRNLGCGMSAGMHEDLRIHARYNPPRTNQAFKRENSEVNGRNVQGDYVFSTRGSCRIQS